MHIEGGRLVANTRNSFVPSDVRGVRGEVAFWERVDERARADGLTRNALIIKAVERYLSNGE